MHCDSAKLFAENDARLSDYAGTILAVLIYDPGAEMQDDTAEDIPRETTEDSIVTVARWRFAGHVVAAVATVIAGACAAVAAYYGAAAL